MDRLSDYDYQLPDHLIAQIPLQDRSASRLLHLERDTGRIVHRQFREIVDLLQAGDLLVLNDTRVTALRLIGRRPTGARVELLLLREIGAGRYEALVKPGKRLKTGSIIELEAGLEATVEGDLEVPKRLIRFAEVPNLRAVLEEIGKTPLPPYIRESLEDPERYQTVYAAAGGSAAAPTAGLHFTPEILGALVRKGVKTAKVTLDVSLDTFRPVEAEYLDDHLMHGEMAALPKECARKIAQCKGRIVAVGTTVVRTLESFATGPRAVEPGRQLSKLFIRPGYEFRIVDGMLTNFHMPRTTMLLMIAAMAGKDSVVRAYDEAIRDSYRFLSFGDSMLIL